jgi:hypothetical protein
MGKASHSSVSQTLRAEYTLHLCGFSGNPLCFSPGDIHCWPLRSSRSVQFSVTPRLWEERLLDEGHRGGTERPGGEGPDPPQCSLLNGLTVRSAFASPLLSAEGNGLFFTGVGR